MSLRLSRPTAAALRSLAERSAADPLTYDPIGISAMAEVPEGYRRKRWSRPLGRDGQVFERAVEALRGWRVHEGAGLLVASSGPPTVGSVVGMAAPLSVGFVEVVCRVVDVVDLPGHFGFTYGTLPVHPESGEESFTVRRAEDGAVTFESSRSPDRHTRWRAPSHPLRGASRPPRRTGTSPRWSPPSADERHVIAEAPGTL